MTQSPSKPSGKARKAGSSPKIDGIREVTRTISKASTALLWGRAAGRCEFAGCNRPLWKSPVTQEAVNIAQMAHIYSFSADGPRGNDGVSDEDLNSFENLLLVCHPCHRKIDQHKDGGRYSAIVIDHKQRNHPVPKHGAVIGRASSIVAGTLTPSSGITDLRLGNMADERCHSTMPFLSERFGSDR